MRRQEPFYFVGNRKQLAIASGCLRPARQRSVRTFTAEFWVSGHQHDRNMAPAEREGHAVGVKQSISLDVRGQEKTVKPAPHAPGCRVRVV